MPVYEYKCSKCGQKFEVRQNFSDKPLTEHEGCGGALEKLISAPAFQFKGTGWYVTDYAKSGSRSAPNGKSDAKGDSGGESKSESKSDSSSGESKSESKSDSGGSSGSSGSSSSTSENK